jgi:hypothetical protein
LSNLIGKTILLYGDEVKVESYESDKGRYKGIKEGKHSIYFTEQQTQYTFKDFIWFRQNVFRIRCFYGINPTYDNKPAVGVDDYQGQFSRIDFHPSMRKPTKEEVDAFHQKRNEHKWKVIEREVGEFEKEDIVSHEGTVAEVIDTADGEVKIKCSDQEDWVPVQEVTMICSKSDRFDRSFFMH